jgi:hypothetical protein
MTNAIPVIFVNPITGRMESMPVEMIGAYVDTHINDFTVLNLEKAAEVAAIRDEEAANNLLLSIVEQLQPEILSIPEGTARDELSVESPSLR